MALEITNNCNNYVTQAMAGYNAAGSASKKRRRNSKGYGYTFVDAFFHRDYN